MGQKSINEELKKGDIFKLNGMKPEQLAKMIASKYGVNPTDFTKGKSDTIVYNPKRTAKPKQQTISKPKDMSVEEYKEKYVIPMKPELKDEEGEEWRPVPNKGRYFGGEADYSNYYEISNLGRLRLINLQNAAKSSISCGYDAPTRKAMQFHLNHKSGMNTCPDVKYMVADAFLGEHDLQDNMVIHIDGDYHNNRADNLKWVPRKRQQQTPEEISEAFAKAFNKGKGRHDLQELISKGVNRIVTESFADKYENAIDTIEYYMGLTDETGMPLSQEQHEQLEEIVNFLKETDAGDNPNTEYWISEAEKLLNNQGQMNISDNIINEAVKKTLQQLKEKSGIEIKPENKGKFTATKKRTGKSTSELLHSKNPKTRQRANFARMAKRRWKPLDEEETNVAQDNFQRFVDVLDECGWGYSSFEEVRSKTTGQTGTRFGVDAYRNGACTSEELQNKLKQAIPENLLVFSIGQHRYAPEIKRMSVVLLDEQPEQRLNEDGQAPNIEDILARINAAGVNQAMPRKQQQQPSVQAPASQHTFQIGTYTYNAGQHQLTGPQGFSKYLSKTEADLLLILCENINQVVSRDTIINAVWTKGEEGKNFNARSVDVYMVKLRQYLSLDPNVNIYSVRGQGFKLEVKE